MLISKVKIVIYKKRERERKRYADRYYAYTNIDDDLINHI